MIREYKITYWCGPPFHEQGDCIERAYSAADAIAQFRVRSRYEIRKVEPVEPHATVDA